MKVKCINNEYQGTNDLIHYEYLTIGKEYEVDEKQWNNISKFITVTCDDGVKGSFYKSRFN